MMILDSGLLFWATLYTCLKHEISKRHRWRNSQRRPV